MTTEPPTDPPSLSEEWRSQRDAESTRERVYATAVQLHEPTRVRDVANRADVSKETAREYLRWFAEIGMVDRVNESPDEFVRNESYFRWRRIQRLESLSPEEREQRLADLSETERAYRERYGTTGPDEVDALEHGDYDDIEAVWEDLDDWRTVRRRIRELEQARRNREENAEAPA